jgi:hypothetical protein
VRCRTALVALTALAVGSTSACGDGDQAETVEGKERTLVSYSREGGIRFQSSALTVSIGGEATVRSEGCMVRFRLEAVLWRRLQQALEGTDFAALAGDYPPPAGAADLISEEIVVGRNAVRLGDFASLPAQARRELKPLVGAFGEILGKGESHQSTAC